MKNYKTTLAIDPATLDKSLLSYFVGLVQTDGNLYQCKSRENVHRGKLTIELSSKDAHILRTLANMVPCNFGIRERTRSVVCNGRQYHSCTTSLTISDLGFRMMAEKLGILYGSKKNVAPSTWEGLSIIDYMRGLFDGDGSVGFTKNGIPFMGFVTQSQRMAEFVRDVISQWTSKPLKKLKRNKRDCIYNLTVFKEDAVVLADHMYCDGCIGIDRKVEAANAVRAWIRPAWMKKNSCPHLPWTEQDICHLFEALRADKTADEISKLLQRTKNSINIKVHKQFGGWRLLKKMGVTVVQSSY